VSHGVVGVTVGVSDGVIELVIDGVTEGVNDGVTLGDVPIVEDGVTELVGVAVIDGVTDGVAPIVEDGVNEGVIVIDGVTEGVTLGVGVGLPGTLSQHSSKFILNTCSQHPSQTNRTYISINVAVIPVISQTSPVVIPVHDVTPVMLVEVNPV
jgi:hypothetical protein